MYSLTQRFPRNKSFLSCSLDEGFVCLLRTYYSHRPSEEMNEFFLLVLMFSQVWTRDVLSPALNSSKSCLWAALCLQQDVPAADLLSSTLLHVLPVELLLLAAAVLTQSDPAHHLLALHAAAVVDGDQQRDVRQLEQCDLEDEGLLVDGVRLTAAH